MGQTRIIRAEKKIEIDPINRTIKVHTFFNGQHLTTEEGPISKIGAVYRRTGRELLRKVCKEVRLVPGLLRRALPW